MKLLCRYGLVFAALVLVTCTSTTGLDFQSCRVDRDCAVDQICSDRGICVDPEDLNLSVEGCDPRQCDIDDDCRRDEACSEGGCCIPKENLECRVDEDCLENEICFLNQCYADNGDDIPDACTEDDDCMRDTDCDDGEFCSDSCKCEEQNVDGDTDGDVLPTDGDVTDGDITDGDIEDGDITDGDTTNDRDRDLIPDDIDNCPNTPNTNQDDDDDDSVGDVCDNCKDDANASQENSDSDKFGDACDNCPEISNVDQEDDDEDDIGNVCDNCPYADNPDQDDADDDGIGDECDPTPEDGPSCQPVDCQPVPVDFLNPCPNYGMECYKPEDAALWEPGTCISECENSDDCPAPFQCNEEGICSCDGGDVNYCKPIECGSANDCTDELSQCRRLPGVDGTICTEECSDSGDCPDQYRCSGGFCRCDDSPQPESCPENQCESGRDCEAIGYPQESACLARDYCTMPCRDDGECLDMFGSLWSCESYGQDGNWCTCTNTDPNPDGDTDPDPNTCPSFECFSRNQCYDLGFPEEGRCLLPAAYCTLPCQSTSECKNAFNDRWSCNQIGGGNEMYCTCE